MADPTVLEALGREVERVGRLLESLGDRQWARVTRCPPLTVHELAVHMLRGCERIVGMVGRGAVDGEPEQDGVTYFRYDAAAEGPRIVARAQQAARDRPGPQLSGAWAPEWKAALDAARGAIEGGDPVLAGVFGAIRMSEYLRTRIVEVTIHHMDLRDALGMPPDPDPGALGAACDVLRGLLGTDARALGIGDVRFALVGTGRASLDAAERAALGPLADLFPLLA